MLPSEVWLGMYVTHREYVAEPPYRMGDHPAYLDPPIIGVITRTPNPHTGTVVVQWPKAAVTNASLPTTLACDPSQLTPASHALIELESEAAGYNMRKAGRWDQ